MKKVDLKSKLKRERVEVCLNCRRFVQCDKIGKYEECADFVEVDDARPNVRKKSARLAKVKVTWKKDGKVTYHKKVPYGYYKQVVVPFNWGYLKKEGEVVAKYQFTSV